MSAAPPTPSPVSNEAALDALRARGGPRFDPVRFRFIEAMARRAAPHAGEAGRLLDERVAALLAAYAADLEQAAPPADTSSSADKPSAIAELVDLIAAHAPPAPDTARPSELKTLKYFRSTWSRLSADRRLTQSLAKLPENAGPLNSHQLVHRALLLMRDLSPEYLNRFMSHVDTLLWLDQVNAANPTPPVARSDSPKKSGRTKSAS